MLRALWHLNGMRLPANIVLDTKKRKEMNKEKADKYIRIADELHSDGATGLDLSPGNPVSEAGAEAISELLATIYYLEEVIEALKANRDHYQRLKEALKEKKSCS